VSDSCVRYVCQKKVCRIGVSAVNVSDRLCQRERVRYACQIGVSDRERQMDLSNRCQIAVSDSGVR